MRAADLLERLCAAGIIVNAQGDKIAYDAPANALTDDLRAAIRTHRAELVVILAAPRKVDGELIPKGDLGWACPGCGSAHVVFYGLPPRRRCRGCFRRAHGQVAHVA